MRLLRNSCLILVAALAAALSLVSIASAAPARARGCSITYPAPTAVTATSATLHARYSCATTLATTVVWEYGLTGAYGTTLTPTAVAGPGNVTDQPVTLTGLAPSTTYHYRATIGGDNGLDATFTTLASATPPSQVDESADLAISQTASPTSVTAGGTVTFTLVATNVAGVKASNVTVRDTLPAGLGYVSATATKGSCGREVSCSIGTLERGESATITIVATANVAGSIVNVADIGATNPDPNVGANNRASTTVQVTAPAATTTAATATQAAATTTTQAAPSRRPTFTVTVTAAIGTGKLAGKVVGAVASRAQACRGSATVLIHTTGGGVASVKANAAGSFVMDLPARTQSLYAQVPSRALPKLNCTSAKSATVFVK